MRVRERVGRLEEVAHCTVPKTTEGDVLAGNNSAGKQCGSEVCCKRHEQEKSSGHVFVGSTCAGTGPDPPLSAPGDCHLGTVAPLLAHCSYSRVP